MHKNVNMHIDMQDVIDNYTLDYSILLSKQLKEEGFTDSDFNEISDVISICDVAINCLTNTFDRIVTQLLTSFEDVKEFIHIYSAFSNPTKKKPIIFRHTCRYILNLIPKLKLTSKPSSNSEEHNIFELCKLIALTNLIQSFVQAKAIQQIESESCVSINIEKDIKIDYTSDKIIRLNSALSHSLRPIHKNYSSEDEFSNLMTILEKNSPTVRILFDYISQFINNQADIFEVTREVNNNNDPIISGLTFSLENVNFSEAVHSPYKTFYRTRFRPIIQINIDGEIHYFTTAWMITEALDEISTNLIPYGELPKGWEIIHELKQFCKQATQKLGKSFEDEVFKIIHPLYIVKRNINGFHNISLKKEIVPNTKRKVGEIDFILVDTISKKMYVIDAKCTKTKFYFQAFIKDKDTFENYSIKLNDKVEWVSSHKRDVGKFFKVSDIDQYSVEGIFVTNSLIYYNFYSSFPIIPLDKLLQYIVTSNRMCVI